jgi:hypothetical protein
MPLQEVPSTTDAPSPFDDSKADIILRSIDQVDFRVYKCLLSLASPVFETMFTLPQPSETTIADEARDGLTVIPIDESARTLHSLLAFCHPGCVPILDNLDDIQEVLRLAMKFDMQGVAQRVVQVLRAPEFMQKEPLRVFAIACRFRFEDEARLAAKETLRFPVSEWKFVKELEYTSGGTHQHLLDYFFHCCVAAGEVASCFDWITRSDYVWFTCTSSSCSDSRKTLVDVGDNAYCPKFWWKKHMQRANATLQICPHYEIISKRDWMLAALKESRCITCLRQGPKDLVRFSNEFSKEVLRRTSEVCLIGSMLP